MWLEENGVSDPSRYLIVAGTAVEFTQAVMLYLAFSAAVVRVVACNACWMDCICIVAFAAVGALEHHCGLNLRMLILTTSLTFPSQT